MTLAVQTVRQLFNGNGSTVDFTIPFAFAANDEVEVIHVSSAGVETAQSYTTHYTISGSTLTMVTAPASGAFLLIRMDKDLEQQTVDFSDQAPFLPTSVESSDDYQASLAQQLNERINRCLTFPKSSTHTNIEIPRSLVDQAGGVLSVNDDEDGFEFGTTVADIAAAIAAGAAAAASAASAASSASSASTSASSASASAAAASASASAAASSASAASAAVGTAKQESIVGVYAAGDTTYTLSETPKSDADVLGFLGTAIQVQGTNYTISGVTVTFAGEDTSATNFNCFYRY